MYICFCEYTRVIYPDTSNIIYTHTRTHTHTHTQVHSSHDHSLGKQTTRVLTGGIIRVTGHEQAAESVEEDRFVDVFRFHSVPDELLSVHIGVDPVMCTERDSHHGCANQQEAYPGDERTADSGITPMRHDCVGRSPRSR